MAKVKVCRFKMYDVTKDEMIVSRRMATREFIEKIHGVPIESSEIDVDSSKVDYDGKTEIGFKG